jgi:hypothetical protein|tara:strand:+ start:1663 stop:2118 length:456 start_codon:yes stop_codon:yes gene_type:complete
LPSFQAGALIIQGARLSFQAAMKGDVRMGDLVNLRQARKQKKRTAKEKQADANRALHGRTRGERTKKDAEDRKADRQHDGHYRGGSEPSENTESDETGDEAESAVAGGGKNPDDVDMASSDTDTDIETGAGSDNVISFFRAANPNSRPDND